MLHSEIVSELKNIGVQVKPYNVQDGFMDMFVNGEVYDMFVKFVKENNLEVIMITFIIGIFSHGVMLQFGFNQK